MGKNMPEMTPEIKAQLDEQIQKLSREDQIILQSCVRHINNGAYWGFDTDMNGLSIKAIQREISENSFTKINAVTLKRGGFVETKNYMTAVEIFRAVGGVDSLPQHIVDEGLKARETSIANLFEFCKKQEKGTVGFYNTNMTGTITINGKTHRSFHLNAFDFFNILAKAGYRVRNEDGMVLPASEVMANYEKFMGGCIKAPSSNSVLVDVAP